MPKKLEQKLKREATKKGFKGKRANAYVFGTLRATGWKPAREKKAHISTGGNKPNKGK